MQKSKLAYNVLSKYVNADYDTIMNLIADVAPTTNFDLDQSRLFTADVVDWITRNDFVAKLSWAIPSEDAIGAMVEFIGSDSVLEVGAGRGLWSRLLSHKLGKDRVIATDICSINGWTSNRFTQETPETILWTDVIQLDVEKAVDKYPTNVLFVCWGSGILQKALQKFNGNKVIVIGEGNNGCTDYLNTRDNPEFKLESVFELPTWFGLHDVIRFYTRV